MFKKFLFCILFFLIFFLVPKSFSKDLDSHPIFKKVKNPFLACNCKYLNNNKDLAFAAKSALNYFENYENKKRDSWEIGSNLFKSQKVYLTITEKSLQKMVVMISKTGDKNFLKQLENNFYFIQWAGDKRAANKNDINLEDGKIRLTKYLVHKSLGSYVKTKEYPYAIYQLPIDEAGLEQDEIEDRKMDFIRFKYSKQDVLSGVLNLPKNKKLVKPLVWLSRDDLEEALLQGTIIVLMPDNKNRFFNVYRSNDVAYDKVVKDKMLQKRYWYFKEVCAKEYRGKNFRKIDIRPYVAFAGDIKNIGLGALVAIKYKNLVTKQNEVRIGIIADTGGAFINNRYQLDYFLGAFQDRGAFERLAKQIPDNVEAYILVAKS